MRILFESYNLIGDGLYISPALRAYAWRSCNPEDPITLVTHKNYIAEIYSRMGVELTVTDSVVGNWDFRHTFDVTAAFKLCDEKKMHIAEAYAELLGVKLLPLPDFGHLKPVFIPTPEELREDEKGVILVSAFSASCASRQGQRPNKMLPWKTWNVILRYLRTLGYPIRFIGGKTDRTALLPISEEEYMLGVSLNRTALIMKQARLLVTLDNGMSHLAASQDTPTYLFYPRCLGLHYILPKGNKNLVYVHMDPVMLHPVTAVSHMKQAIPVLLKLSEEVKSPR